MVIWLGGFHIAFNCLSLLGKKYDGSGKEDILIEAGVYCSAQHPCYLKVRATTVVCKLTATKWLSDHDNCGANQAELAKDIKTAK